MAVLCRAHGRRPTFLRWPTGGGSLKIIGEYIVGNSWGIYPLVNKQFAIENGDL